MFSHAKKRTRASFVISTALAATTVGGIATPFTHAATGTWTATAGGSWADSANWAGGVIPGSTDGASGASQDLALFNTAGGGDGTETINDANRNLKSIEFDIAAASNGRIIALPGSTTTLYLSDSGSAHVTTGTTTTGSSAINAPLQLNGTSYTFDNDSTNANSGLKINGAVTGGNAGATTLYLDGANNVTATTSNSQVQGAITDGASASLSIVKNGTGVWELRPTTGSNTYSGDTIINGGLLRIMSVAGAMSPNTNFIINNGGTLRPNITGGIAKTITVNTGGTVQANADTTITSLASNSGPAFTFNFIGTTGAISQGLMLNLTGTTDGQGGVKLALQNATGKITFSKAIDLGAVTRPFDIAHSTTNEAAGDPDLQVSGAVSGSGGLLKIGPGGLKLNNSANSFTGLLEVREGSIRFNNSNALTGNPPLSITGGDFNVSTFEQIVGPVTMTKGTVSANSTTPGKITAPSFTFNVQSGDTATVKANLADASAGPSSVTKTGDGRAVLSGPNTYTGTTSISGGILSVSATGIPANNSIIVNSGGKLEMSQSGSGVYKPGNLAINSGGKASLNTNGASVLDMNAANLTIAGVTNAWSGQLDITNNDAIFRSTDVNRVADVARITNQLKQGLNATTNSNQASFWTGQGIITSSGWRGGTNYTGVGVTYNDKAAAGLAPGPLYTSFDGQTVGVNDVLVKYTWFGDADLDGAVTSNDYFQIDTGFLGNKTGWINGDFDYNGVVNTNDYFLIDSAFLAQSGTVLAPAGAQLPNGVTTVPEPTSLGVFAFSAAALLTRRSRRRLRD